MPPRSQSKASSCLVGFGAYVCVSSAVAVDNAEARRELTARASGATSLSSATCRARCTIAVTINALPISTVPRAVAILDPR